MRQPRPAVIGRERELAVVDAFATTTDGSAASLVIEGVAGIGKTTIWAHAIDRAERGGVAVRSSRCTTADAEWAFSGLGDLLEGTPPSILDELPEIQRYALSAALLIDPTPPSMPANMPSDRVVGVAVLSVLRLLCRTEPLLLGIDDVQWLDGASRGVLSFALHRLGNERIRLLASQRSSMNTADDTENVCLGLAGTRLPLEGVSVGALKQIIRSTVSLSVSRPMLTRLHHTTGGNPMLALEMSRALERRGSEPNADEPLPIPSDVRLLVAERIDGLSASARDVLVISAALAHPTIATVSLLVNDPASLTGDLVELSKAGAMEADGQRLRFTHPLLSSVPYEGLSGQERRALHKRLAVAVDDPEEHARHAALAVDGPDETVADALDVAADRARRRGGAGTATELAALAVARTPPQHRAELNRRRLAAARYSFHVGDPSGARAMVSAALDDSATGADRVDALLLLAMMDYWTEGSPSAAKLCEQALEESGDDRRLLARCHAALADLAPFEAPRLLEHARLAVELLSKDHDPPAGLLANALKNVAYHELRLGQGLSLSTLERAVVIEASCEPLPVLERVGMYIGMLYRFAGEFDEARTWLLAMLQCAQDEGDDSALPTIYGHLALLECWAGHYFLAMTYVASGNEFTILTGVASPSVTAAQAFAQSAIGNIDEARQVATAAIADDEARHDDADVACDLRSLGFAELAAGNLSAAADHLLQALTIVDDLGVLEPSILRIHADAVEALVGLGRLAEAEGLTAELERSVHAHSVWARTMALRCRGLLALAAGDLAGAEAALTASVSGHAAISMPFEEARTLLWLGVVLRRAGQRRNAHTALDGALRVFESLGTPMFAERTRAELARLGGRSADTNALTSTEAQVAQLVGAGRTNTEVAAALYVNVRTVESHLTRIYRKLGVRSRTELARIPLPGTAPHSAQG